MYDVAAANQMIGNTTDRDSMQSGMVLIAKYAVDLCMTVALNIWFLRALKWCLVLVPKRVSDRVSIYLTGSTI